MSVNDIGLELPEQLRRKMRFRGIVVDAMNALPRSEFQWLLKPLLTDSTRIDERAAVVTRLTNLTIAVAQAFDAQCRSVGKCKIGVGGRGQ